MDDCVIWVEDTPPVIELQILNDVIAMDLSLYKLNPIEVYNQQKKKKKGYSLLYRPDDISPKFKM